MATTMNRHTQVVTIRTMPQKVCIALGVALLLVGIGGIAMPGMLGMHLSLSHNLIHLVSGGLGLWSGYTDDSRKANTFCMAFGAIYGLLGLAGFAFGRPGFPGVGNMQVDQNLLRLIPNALEFGTSDHVVHIILGVAFLGSALVWKNRHNQDYRSGRRYTETSPGGGKDVFRKNSESDLRDASLGRSDINRPIDESRRKEFENRI